MTHVVDLAKARVYARKGNKLPRICRNILLFEEHPIKCERVQGHHGSHRRMGTALTKRTQKVFHFQWHDAKNNVIPVRHETY